MPWWQVTPAHTDPHHNLLAQVRGRKYVRLYRPADLPALYPFASGLTTNSSQVRRALIGTAVLTMLHIALAWKMLHGELTLQCQLAQHRTSVQYSCARTHIQVWHSACRWRSCGEDQL